MGSACRGPEFADGRDAGFFHSALARASAAAAFALSCAPPHPGESWFHCPAGWLPPPHSRRATREGPRVHSCGRLPSTMGAGKCQEEPRLLGNGAETFGAPWARQLQARLPEVASAWQQVARLGGVERRGRAQAPSICSGLVT